MNGYGAVAPGIFQLMTPVGDKDKFNAQLCGSITEATRLVTQLASEQQQSFSLRRHRQGAASARSDKAIGGNGRLFYSFRGAANRDQLVPRRLGATIPGLAEEWHSGAWEMGVLNSEDLQPGSIVCGSPNALEDCGTGLFLAIAFGGKSLDGFAQRIETRVDLLPGIDQRLRIERFDDAPYFFQFQQPRAFGNEQANAELDGRDVFNEPLNLQHAEQIKVGVHRRPRIKGHESRMKSHAEGAEVSHNVKEIFASVPFV